MTGRGRPRSFDRTKALARAMELFWARGYNGTSITDLTSAMGINPPSLYAAFGSKAQLFQEAVALYGEIEGAPVWKPLKEAPTAREAVAGFLRASATAFARRGKPRGCLVILGALHANETNMDVCRRLRSLRARNLSLLEERLRHGVAGGELPRDLDCRAVARFVMAVQQGMSIQARDGASPEDLASIAEVALAILGEPLTG
ncbi:MAG: TetR/AcrR family transcriptional regulator [Rhodospirillaceae bacterium]|nr:TetR/AcrR family transcriptional regulator [Rhodospirillaceae bacterium]